jgi:pimeloyl-ACP methyl ester carboxylesterase
MLTAEVTAMDVPVIGLPGGVMPAGMRYAALASALGEDTQFRFKDLEVYAGEEPPAAYSIELEIEALARFADSLGFDRFHLVGYSGGGFVSLAFAGALPDRLSSLALFEPARVPGELSPEESDQETRLQGAVAGLAGPEFMRAFVDRRDGAGRSPDQLARQTAWIGR